MAGQLEAMHETLKQFHRRNPLLAGVSKEELRGKQLPGAPPWLLDALLARVEDARRRWRNRSPGIP